MHLRLTDLCDRIAKRRAELEKLVGDIRQEAADLRWNARLALEEEEYDPAQVANYWEYQDTARELDTQARLLDETLKSAVFMGHSLETFSHEAILADIEAHQ